jgi:hypothetical protein
VHPQERVLQIQIDVCKLETSSNVCFANWTGRICYVRSYFYNSFSAGMQTTQALICVIQHKAVCKRRDIIGHATQNDGWLVRVGRWWRTCQYVTPPSNELLHKYFCVWLQHFPGEIVSLMPSSMCAVCECPTHMARCVMSTCLLTHERHQSDPSKSHKQLGCFLSPTVPRWVANTLFYSFLASEKSVKWHCISEHKRL